MKYFLLMVAMLASSSTQFRAEKESFETRLKEKIQKSLSPFFKENEYIVTVNVTLQENELEQQESEPVEINESETNLLSLSKMGMKFDGNLVMKKIFYTKKTFFDMVENIDIKIMIPDTAREKLEGDIKPVVDSVLASYSGLTYALDINRFNSIKPEPPPPLPPQSPKIRNWVDYAEAFQIPIAMVVVSFLVFFLFILYIRKFGKLEGEKLEVMRTQTAAAAAPVASSGDSVPVAASAGAPAAAAGGAPVSVAAGGAIAAGGVVGVGAAGAVSGAVTAAVPPPNIDRLLGFNQFEEWLLNSPHKAIRVLKDWISLRTYEAQLALTVVPQHFGIDKIVDVLKDLDEEDRKNWRDQILDNVPANAYERVNQYILSLSVESILVPPKPGEDELKELLLNITPEEAAALAKQDPVYGAVFANLFEPPRVAKMFAQMDAELVLQVTEQSLSFSANMVEDIRQKFVLQLKISKAKEKKSSRNF